MVEARTLGPHPAIAAWAEAALTPALTALQDQPRRAGGTWTVGLDLAPNDASGAINGTHLPWDVLSLTPQPLHRAQLSTIHPGYPRPDAGEPDTANHYRLTRDAAHLDGLLAVGPDKRRMIKEPHAWILGLPLTDTPASPLVVWEGSAAILRHALLAALSAHPPEAWADIDVTDAYQTARRHIFTTCRRVELPVKRGQATLLHRLTLHGVAPWHDGADTEARIIAYFRPLLGSVQDWLTQP
ncbi:MAG: hypothetical protein ACRC14_08885 [Paracoccaceae bacterium]